MPKHHAILRIAIPSPLHRSFDYLPPPDCDPAALAAGMRVRVPFGRTQTIGLLLDVNTHSRIEGERLKAALEVLDEQPALPAETMRLLHWASGYYHHPAGEVFSAALPVLLRHGRAAHIGKRAKRQGGAEHPDQLPDPRPPLNPSQHEAVAAVCGALDEFQAFLLDGVTGSGKTEVYLHIIERVLGQGRQALVLAPEIGLTPQLVARFQRRFDVPLAVLHSGLTDRERLDAWLMARDGQAPIVIGTRSAVFTPLKRPGVIIVDEEHDLSFKQQEGFRYNARDVAVMRARQANLPVVLGSATPSLESLYNAAGRRYRRLHLPERAGNALHPLIEVLDVRGQPMQDSLSQPLLDLAGRHLADRNQVLLFLNRRGYSPTLLCHDCGWVAECRRCDAHLTLHQESRLLVCHHCGTQRPIDRHCPKCNGADLRALGHGTERIEQAMAQRFPAVNMARIDRDTTRRKGALENLLEGIHAGEHRLLIGTQMLTKGHHFPDVTLVGILDADQGLFSADFRGAERMAQLIIQVAGRAGRADKPGQVVIQTHHPDHPLLHLLVTQGYHRFAQAALEERRAAELPPYSAMALLRAEATKRDLPQAFLVQASAAAEKLDGEGVNLLGPIPAPMEKRAGRYRAHLLLQAPRRGDLHRLLDAWVPRLEKLPLARKVRWALDVDPMEMF